MLSEFINSKEIVILDGGAGTALENFGLNPPEAWNSGWNLDDEKIYTAVSQLYKSYLEAGVDILTINTYNISVEAAVHKKIIDPEGSAMYCFEQNIELAKKMVKHFMENNPNSKEPLLVASIGSYGTCLPGFIETASRVNDNKNKLGIYGIFSELIRSFYRKRISVIVNEGINNLAFETIQNIEEAREICKVLKEFEDYNIEAWISFTCKDGEHVDGGDLFSDCIIELNKSKSIVGIGINCTNPYFVENLLEIGRKLTDKLLVCYPNSGELYDSTNGSAISGCHTKWCKGEFDPAHGKDFVKLAKKWKEKGANIIGGCCRIDATDIKLLVDSMK